MTTGDAPRRDASAALRRSLGLGDAVIIGLGSMIGAGIFSGDVLVIDRSKDAQDGSIVVAAVNGELVVKRLSVQGTEHLLLSENDQYAPIVVSEDEECFVWGVVVGSVRTF